MTTKSEGLIPSLAGSKAQLVGRGKHCLMPVWVKNQPHIDRGGETVCCPCIHLDGVDIVLILATEVNI